MNVRSNATGRPWATRGPVRGEGSARKVVPAYTVRRRSIRVVVALLRH